MAAGESDAGPSESSVFHNGIGADTSQTTLAEFDGFNMTIG